MQLILYVHDYSRQIGHSRAMAEVLEELRPDKVKVVCYTHTAPEDLYLNKPVPYEFYKVPFSGLKPFLLRNLFFQLYTKLMEWKWKSHGDISITIGCCSFNGDIVNVQFCHFLWEKLYFEVNKTPFYKWIYKKILLRYLTLCEDFYYRKENLKFIFLSKFISKAITDRYQIPERNQTIAYSSANTEEFKPNDLSKEELKEQLSIEHPCLSALRVDRPILLFIGALERKGLPLFINLIPDDIEFIIIGESEAKSQFSIPQKKNFYHIKSTQKVNMFYALADTFVFPTLYEPFGLVILEAALSGLEMIISKEMVGASELLEGLDGVEFVNPREISSATFKKKALLPEKQRQLWHNQRKNHLMKTNWHACAQKWHKVINSL